MMAMLADDYVANDGDDADDDDDDIYIMMSVCLFVCLSRKMITLPNGTF